MSVTSVDKDYDALAFTLIAEFDAPIERVWELWSDARQLERWWGPPTYPATVEKHDLTPGGEVAYFMTGPDGATPRGLWRVAAVDPPTALEFTDAFADADGTPVEDMPVATISVRLASLDGGTRMKMRSTFETRDDMEKWLRTGTDDGQQQAVAQIDALLVEGSAA
jgi:uncharacterized protein YndB with AHSA1/START domain